MLKGIKLSLGWPAFLLILEAALCITQSHGSFVQINTQRILRGSQVNDFPLSLSQRELPEVDTKKKDKNGKNDNKKEMQAKPDKEIEAKGDKKKEKDIRNGVTKIEAAPPRVIDGENSGRDEIKSPIISSETLQNSETITTEFASEAPKESVPSDLTKTETVSTSIDNDKSLEPIIRLPKGEESAIAFDGTKFTVVTKMEPITFELTVSNFMPIVDNDNLKTHLKEIVENVLDMKSNLNWYPSHEKSMLDLSFVLLPSSDSELEHKERLAGHNAQAQLIINGYVAVHANNQAAEVLASSSRSAEGTKQQTNDVNDSLNQSTFHESFDHSMLLYFTFWGVESLERILEKECGLSHPVITSVSIGNEKLMTFGIDKDDNYLFGGDHNFVKSKHILQTKASGSSARASKYGCLTFILISVFSGII